MVTPLLDEAGKAQENNVQLEVDAGYEDGDIPGNKLLHGSHALSLVILLIYALIKPSPPAFQYNPNIKWKPQAIRAPPIH